MCNMRMTFAGNLATWASWTIPEPHMMSDLCSTLKLVTTQTAQQLYKCDVSVSVLSTKSLDLSKKENFPPEKKLRTKNNFPPLHPKKSDKKHPKKNLPLSNKKTSLRKTNQKKHQKHSKNISPRKSLPLLKKISSPPKQKPSLLV